VPTEETGFDVPERLSRVREGDESAARDLVDHLHPLVSKIVRSHLPRRMEEEDLVQTVYMKIFSKLEQYSGDVPLEHWVSRIAVNTCLKQIRKESIRPELRLADLSEEEQAVVESIACSTEESQPSLQAGSRELMDKLLECLPPADRLIINLIHLEGRSVAEAQAITGWSGPVVKIRAFRARNKMKKQLELLSEEKGL
jgi:RNA polymerase sigma-70 factor (ECF subfamily)